MSTFSRAQSDHLSPPDCHDDPHPWSEELCGILEEAGVAQEHIDRACKMFDSALEADRVKYVGYHDLLLMASLCSEFSYESATFWHNQSGRNKSGHGSSYEETLTDAINKYSDQDGVDSIQEIGDYLADVVRLEDDPLNKAFGVLRKLRYTYVFSATPPPQPSGSEGSVAELQAMVLLLRTALAEAMDWNWLDDDARPSGTATFCDAAMCSVDAMIAAAQRFGENATHNEEGVR